MAGVYTFHHDPGELSAAFVWERTVRLFMSTPPPSTVVRYAAGGWSGVVEPLARRARELGVELRTGARARELPEPPVILAIELGQASELLGEPLPSLKIGSVWCRLRVSHRGEVSVVVASFKEPR